MAAFETADKARRIADNAHDIAEIQKIINLYQQGRGIDREKVTEIIGRLNGKDPAIALFNSKLNPGWTLIADATDKQIIGNLNLTLLYLSGKMTAEGFKDLIKGDNNQSRT